MALTFFSDLLDANDPTVTGCGHTCGHKLGAFRGFRVRGRARQASAQRRITTSVS